MADKELRRLKRGELLEMLLMQCREMERLQREADEMKKQFAEMAESYGRLKKKLDVKDERLNQKDAKIAQLSSELAELRECREEEWKEMESLTERVLRLSSIFQEVWQKARQYLGDSQKS